MKIVMVADAGPALTGFTAPASRNMRHAIGLFVTLTLLSACAPVATVRSETIMEAHVKTMTQERRREMMAFVSREAIGIRAGAGAPNKAVVFYDPHCAYCTDLWSAAQLVKEQVDFLWVPVGLLGEDSLALAAAMLEAHDPLGMMAANELAMRTTGSPMAMTAAAAAAAVSKVERNTDLLKRADPGAPIQSVPFMYYQAANGNVELLTGAKDGTALRAFLKLK